MASRITCRPHRSTRQAQCNALGFGSMVESNRAPKMRRREDKDDRTYFRSDRLFLMNGRWYFSTREGDYGPFGSREIARAALARFVRDKVELDSFQKAREKDTRKAKTSLAERLRGVEPQRSHVESQQGRVGPQRAPIEPPRHRTFDESELLI